MTRSGLLFMSFPFTIIVVVVVVVVIIIIYLLERTKNIQPCKQEHQGKIYTYRCPYKMLQFNSCKLLNLTLHIRYKYVESILKSER